jgi:hypothetical protein
MSRPTGHGVLRMADGHVPTTQNREVHQGAGTEDLELTTAGGCGKIADSLREEYPIGNG